MKTINYVLTIKTDKYAGNFERELCAYCTGIIGECDVGSEEAKMFNKKYPDKFIELITQRPDEHGCYRPVSLSGNINAIDIYFEEMPKGEELNLINLRAIEYGKLHDIKILAFTLYKETKITERKIIG